MSTRERFLIVDGHSMIFAWEDLLALHQQRNELARQELAKRLASHQDATGMHVVLVFDGRGSKHDSRKDDSGIQIIYSRTGETADTVVERLAAKYAETYDILVATNDRMEQQTVSSFGASWIDSNRLALDMEASALELSERIRRHNRRRG